MKKLGFAGNLGAAFATVLASSSVVVSSAEAATFAFSKTSVSFANFNQFPQSQDTFSVANTNTVATLGQVTATSDANAIFSAQTLEAGNFTFSQVAGDGLFYSGEAVSEARVVGNFFIPTTANHQVFTFDFTASLNLETTIDKPGIESANALAGIAFFIYAGSNPDTLSLVDFFTIAGQLDTDGDGDFLESDNTSSVIFRNKALSSLFGGLQETATATFKGSYQRAFDAGTYISLVETKASAANVQAVPEPSTLLAVLVSGAVGAVLKRWR